MTDDTTSQQHRGLVLIIDDDPVTRQTYADLLSGETCDLLFAASGPEGLSLARSTPPDLILLDVMMPEMDGYEVCTQLRSDATLAEVPVLMVTALDDRASLLRGIRVGADGFVSKPFEHIELRTRVQTIVRLNRYARLLEERKRSEIALSEREALYRSLFDDNKAAMLLLEPESMRIVDANPAAAVFYGWSKTILRGKRFEDILVDCPDHFVTSLSRGDWPVLQEHRLESGEVRQVEVYAGRLKTGVVNRVYCIVHDVTQRRTAEQQLQRSRENLRALALHLQTIREEERTRISREVHDELGQILTGVKMDIASVQGSMRNDPQAATTRVEHVLDVIDSAIKTVQRIAAELRPGILDHLGLVPALEWQSEEFSTRTGIACAFSSSSDDIQIERERATAIFRVFQETLTNIIRHAHATHVSARLQTTGDEVVLRVRDTGVGIDALKPLAPTSLGLLGMRERLHAFDGIVEFRGSPGVGTIVLVRMPIHPRSH